MLASSRSLSVQVVPTKSRSLHITPGEHGLVARRPGCLVYCLVGHRAEPRLMPMLTGELERVYSELLWLQVSRARDLNLVGLAS